MVASYHSPKGGLRVVRKFDRAEIVIKDSLLILYGPLAKLAKSFNLEVGKDIFPYDFVSLDNLDYIGPVPDYKYFDSTKVSLDDYLDYKSRFKDNKWCLRTELENYCVNDCKVLYHIVEAFNNLIIDSFNVDIHKLPTLASVAYRIYKANYLKYSFKEFSLPNKKGKVKVHRMSQLPVIGESNFNILKEGYYGGHCDMYIPFNRDNQLIYCYDVNSLYPYVMRAYEFPTKFICKTEGDVRVTNPKLYNNSR